MRSMAELLAQHNVQSESMTYTRMGTTAEIVNAEEQRLGKILDPQNYPDQPKAFKAQLPAGPSTSLRP